MCRVHVMHVDALTPFPRRGAGVRGFDFYVITSSYINRAPHKFQITLYCIPYSIANYTAVSAVTRFVRCSYCRCKMASAALRPSEKGRLTRVRHDG